MKRAAVVVALLAVALAPALAEDFVAMPVADHPGAGHIEGHYIFWDLNGPPGPERASIWELFIGVTDRFEVDLERWDFQGLDGINVLNAYWWAIPESPDHPSLVFGATNLTKSDLPPSPGGTGFDNRVNPCVISAYNLRAPQGPPSRKDPLIRAYAGYGWNWHDSRLFGGVQLVVHPKLGFAVMNYQGQPAYMVGVKPTPESEIHAGWFHGEPLIHIGYNYNLRIN